MSKLNTLTFAAKDAYFEEFSYYAAELIDCNAWKKCAMELFLEDNPKEDADLINWDFLHGYFFGVAACNGFENCM
jgi:hypothetical protein